MAFVPDSIIHLLKVNIDNSYKNQITFSNEFNQYSYFYQKRQFTEENLTYQRKDNIIMFPAHIDNLYGVNYCMYRNTNFTNKWFYAFIVNMEYINDECTAIKIETDCWQTWYFNIDIRQCFVEREHVNSDRIGEHLTPENLETGEYITTGYDNVDMGQMRIVVATVLQPESESYQGGSLIDGVYSGLEYTYFDLTEINQLNNFIEAYSIIGHLDYIVGIFMCPAKLISTSTEAIMFNVQINNIDGYIPKNKKLFISPYNMVVVSNNKGSIATYHIEKFSHELGSDISKVYFILDSAFSMQPTAILRPQDYKGELHNWDEGIILSGFPQCSWVGDIFANWYAQNKASIFTNLATGLSSSVLQVAGGNIAGGLMSGVSGIANTLATMYNHSVAPLQINGQVSGDSANVSWNRALFTMKNVQIQREFAEKIDNFFSMFGYAIGKVKKPNITGRPNWNYVKTQNCDIIGGIPNNDLIEIKSMFNRGVTFWHNGDLIGNYNLPNEIGETPTPPPEPEPEPEPPDEQTMISPINGNWVEVVTSEFGWRNYPPDPYHTGIDLAKPLNDPIFCTLKGVVKTVKNSTTGFGKHLYITHGNNIATMYAHCNEILVTQGQEILQGQKIALIGETGLSTGPHLHYQVEVNGTPVNPRDYLPI